MKVIAIFLMMVTALGLLLALSPGSADAASPEKLYVCGPCSSFFIDDAKAVVEEMGIGDLVTVRRSSCLGECGVPPVVGFRGEVYHDMTAERLKALLEAEVLVASNNTQ
ncbi:MAG TPA: (2Fe-2S) ferredoxin domain-containing protein [Synergistetes bacterium]|nr:(2Fe-2S) ferredoxin domain-containing protein [Synergistota bacterium]